MWTRARRARSKQLLSKETPSLRIRPCHPNAIFVQLPIHLLAIVASYHSDDGRILPPIYAREGSLLARHLLTDCLSDPTIDMWNFLSALAEEERFDSMEVVLRTLVQRGAPLPTPPKSGTVVHETVVFRSERTMVTENRSAAVQALAPLFDFLVSSQTRAKTFVPIVVPWMEQTSSNARMALFRFAVDKGWSWDDIVRCGCEPPAKSLAGDILWTFRLLLYREREDASMLVGLLSHWSSNQGEWISDFWARLGELATEATVAAIVRDRPFAEWGPTVLSKALHTKNANLPPDAVTRLVQQRASPAEAEDFARRHAPRAPPAPGLRGAPRLHDLGLLWSRVFLRTAWAEWPSGERDAWSYYVTSPRPRADIVQLLVQALPQNHMTSWPYVDRLSDVGVVRLLLERNPDVVQNCVPSYVTVGGLLYHPELFTWIVEQNLSFLSLVRSYDLQGRLIDFSLLSCLAPTRERLSWVLRECCMEQLTEAEFVCGLYRFALGDLRFWRYLEQCAPVSSAVIDEVTPVALYPSAHFSMDPLVRKHIVAQRYHRSRRRHGRPPRSASMVLRPRRNSRKMLTRAQRRSRGKPLGPNARFAPGLRPCHPDAIFLQLPVPILAIVGSYRGEGNDLPPILAWEGSVLARHLITERLSDPTVNVWDFFCHLASESRFDSMEIVLMATLLQHDAPPMPPPPPTLVCEPHIGQLIRPGVTTTFWTTAPLLPLYSFLLSCPRRAETFCSRLLPHMEEHDPMARLELFRHAVWRPVASGYWFGSMACAERWSWSDMLRCDCLPPTNVGRNAVLATFRHVVQYGEALVPDLMAHWSSHEKEWIEDFWSLLGELGTEKVVRAVVGSRPIVQWGQAVLSGIMSHEVSHWNLPGVTRFVKDHTTPAEAQELARALLANDPRPLVALWARVFLEMPWKDWPELDRHHWLDYLCDRPNVDTVRFLFSVIPTDALERWPWSDYGCNTGVIRLVLEWNPRLVSEIAPSSEIMWGLLRQPKLMAWIVEQNPRFLSHVRVHELQRRLMVCYVTLVALAPTRERLAWVLAQCRSDRVNEKDMLFYAHTAALTDIEFWNYLVRCSPQPYDVLSLIPFQWNSLPTSVHPLVRRQLRVAFERRAGTHTKKNTVKHRTMPYRAFALRPRLFRSKVPGRLARRTVHTRA